MRQMMRGRKESGREECNQGWEAGNDKGIKIGICIKARRQVVR